MWPNGAVSYSHAIIKRARKNKPYDLDVLLHLDVLQNLYNLSDEVAVAETVDR